MVKRDLVKSIILVMVFVVALIGLRLYVFEPYTVTEQDANNVVRQGEMVVAFKTVKADYSDLVLYKVGGKKYIGRIIAKSGDSVTFMDDVLYLNNKVQEEPYIESLKATYHKQFVNGAYFTNDFSIETLTQTVDGTIPKRQYLILNDDRTNSADSRQHGLINQSDLIGVISFRLTPLSEFGFVDSV
ncbi:signal peptidase I [Streptococcus merionis]|uniref:Signal peptidase I n=1 Tax=Streptococcus merionis TaxID=400065 RepID=A0A239SQQ4_9STRE|nr:signal peptidase I [Streptococcus merionis]SNU87579.1 Signal peptidase I [Streptococcus merionis]